MLVTGLSGSNGQPPAAEQVEQAMQSTVERVRSGLIKRFLALDAAGAILQFV